MVVVSSSMSRSRLPLVELALLGSGATRLTAPLRIHGFAYVRSGGPDGVSLARRIFEHTPASIPRAALGGASANPRGLYAFRGTPQPGADVCAITAYQFGAANTRALREAYYDGAVPSSSVHDNLPLADASLMADIQRYFDAMSSMSRLLFAALAAEDSRLHSLRDCRLDSTLEFKCYEGGAGVQLAAHRDQSVLTLLHQGGGVGSVLQVETAHGEWLDAPPIESAVLVNAGDYLEQLTGGDVRSATHRVVGRDTGATTKRYSVAFFAAPTWDFPLSAHERIGDVVPFYG